MGKSAAKSDNIMREAEKNTVAGFFSKSTQYWKSIYDRNQEEINRLYSTNIIDRKESVLQMLDECTGDAPSRILDVGCGPGVFMEEALKRGHTIVGMDIADQMTKEAKEAVKRHYNERAICVVGDIEQMPFGDGSFDVVLCIGVLSYLQDDKTSIEEISRVVRKNGAIILAVPNKLRMNVFLDPCYIIEKAKHILLDRHDRKFTDANEPSCDDVLQKMRRYVRGQLTNTFLSHNLRELEVRSLGYGPMTFWKKEFMPVGLSLKMNRFLENMTRNRSLWFVTMFANHFVFCLRKE